MKKRLYLLIFAMLTSIVFAKPIYAQTLLFDSVKMAVVNYHNIRYSKNNINPLSPDDLNKRFAIIDIRTQKPVKNEIKDGNIYHCKLFGDDVFGVYILLEKGELKLMEIENTLQIERARLFMLRHEYTPEQMARYFDYFTLIFIKEQLSLSYPDFIDNKDYLEYLKEYEMTPNIDR